MGTFSRRSAALGVATVAAMGTVAVGATPAGAHVTITTYGTTTTAGVTNTFYFRVPHGCADEHDSGGAARTSRIVVDIPEAATGVKPMKIPGWEVTIAKDSAGNVRHVAWIASSADEALPDWTFADFGLRASLKGAEGEKIGFPVTQYCDYADDGSPIEPRSEEWRGADTPTVTLVAQTNAVTGSASLADLKSRLALVTDVVNKVLAELRAKGILPPAAS